MSQPVTDAPPSIGYRLPVVDVVAETAESRSLIMAVPDSLQDIFDYAPGQFLTIRIPADGDRPELARCYSLASIPKDRTLMVNVKRVAGGVGSNWLCDHMSPGDEVEVLPPAGRFTPSDLNRNVALFAAGSGITPIISIARSILENGTGTVMMVYANRDESSVIYADALRKLVAEHPDRFTLIHHLESTQGLPTRASISRHARPYAEDATAFVCGPQAFMNLVEASLLEAGFPRDRVIIERFVSLSGDPFRPLDSTPNPASGDPTEKATTLQVHIDGQAHHLAWPRGKTLLDVLLEQGIAAPYSCREGACSACTCQVLTGEIAMERNEVLEDEDLAEGYILACQAQPITDTVHVTYD